MFTSLIYYKIVSYEYHFYFTATFIHFSQDGTNATFVIGVHIGSDMTPPLPRHSLCYAVETKRQFHLQPLTNTADVIQENTLI